MWAPSMGLTFKAISTTCQQTEREDEGQCSEAGGGHSSEEKDFSSVRLRQNRTIYRRQQGEHKEAQGFWWDLLF